MQDRYSKFSIVLIFDLKTGGIETLRDHMKIYLIEYSTVQNFVISNNINSEIINNFLTNVS